MSARLLLAALLLASAARGAVIASGDYGGADLVVANGDVLSGVYTNVGLFSVPSGVTATVAATASGANLQVYATTVSIVGVLSGAGRGQPAGDGGQVPSGAGQNGTGGGPAAAGGGTGAAATKGGGGGGGGGAGGVGAGDSGGGVGAAGGSAYGSTGTVTSPISSDDLYQGSGGGGGGANATTGGGPGAAGGAAIYIEAASMTVTGSILVDGSTASAVTFGAPGVHEGAGGGGGGGTVLLRITSKLSMGSGAIMSAKGGGGGNVDSGFVSTVKAPGGGGGGGRIKVFYASSAFGSVTFSTAAGAPGNTSGFSGTVDASTPPASGVDGSASFGVIASSPTAFAVSAVHVTSISWTWGAAPTFGDAPAASQLYRVFASTKTAPLTTPETTASSLALGTTEASLTPNTTYFRFVTAFTDWGDSFPSNSISTHTLAADPSPAATPFSSIASNSLTLSWTAGSPSNPSYTVYELDASTSSAFAAPVSTGFTTSISSSPASLSANTTYFFRVRAVNLDGVPTSYAATQATATLAAVPSSPVAGPVYITSGVFTWSAGGNPPDTQYLAQVSSDNFFSLTDSSATLSTSATFFTLSPGTQYFLRVEAINRNSVPSSFSTVISTSAGNLSNTSAPSAPGAPVADRSFSADGTATFAWAPASSPVGILDYNLIVGSLPGGSDLFAGNVSVSSYAAAGMLTGKTYYAQVRARSNAGAYSLFSSVSSGLPVFIPAQTAPISKPFNWPNPFDPSKGPTQIGFFLEQAADVTLTMYNLQGRFVSKTASSFPAGNQIMSWNGANDAGMRVAPGGYIGVIDKHYGGRTESQRIKIAVLY